MARSERVHLLVFSHHILKIVFLSDSQECGPTICGDEHSDPELMNYLGAKLVKQMGNNLYVKFHTQQKSLALAVIIL